ncbi:MAG TPA: hypothetical protein VEZ11_12810 [Thermoanaerobaculia bacterium]|nr:hypothetical protein [Thermoanaerobaculia bacterium]
MRMTLITILALAMVVTLAPVAQAADDGNTQLKLSSTTLFYPNDADDAVNTTGTGNVKAIRCNNIVAPITMQITVNGGTTQSFGNLGDSGADTLWIPMNLRFTSSIRVRFLNGNYYQTGGCVCTVSLGLD